MKLTGKMKIPDANNGAARGRSLGATGHGQRARTGKTMGHGRVGRGPKGPKG